MLLSEIIYRKGNDNNIVDAVSRMFNSEVTSTIGSSNENAIASSIIAGIDESNVAAVSLEHTDLDSELLALSYPYMSWLDDLWRHVQKDDWILKKSQAVLQTPSDSAPLNLLKYQLGNGFLKYKNWIVISLTSQWRTKIFE